MGTKLTSSVIAMAIVITIPQFSLGQWVKTNGPADQNVTALVANGSTLFAGTFQQGVFFSNDNGASWTAANSGLPNLNSANVASLAAGNGKIYAGLTMYAGVFASADNGASWIAINSGLNGNGTMIVYALAIKGKDLFAATMGYNGVSILADTSTTWAPAGSGLTDNIVEALAVKGTDLFAGTSRAGVCRSGDNGRNWTAVDSGLFSMFEARSLFVNGTDLFVGGYGIYRSVDNGASWTAASTGLPRYSYVLSFAASGNILFAGTSTSVFLSINNGASWTECNSGLPASTSINSLIVLGTNLFAATSTGGVYLLQLNNIAVRQRPNSVPEQFALEFLSPIGSGHNAAISFSLPHAEPVLLTVYNLLGHQIALLVNRKVEAGKHSIFWDTRPIAPGYYILKIQACSATLSKRIALLRQ